MAKVPGILADKIVGGNMGTILGYASLILLLTGHWIFSPIVGIIAIIVGIVQGAKEFERETCQNQKN